MGFSSGHFRTRLQQANIFLFLLEEGVSMQTKQNLFLHRDRPHAPFVQSRNKREIVVLLTCLSLLHSSSYVTRSALSTQTHYQQTRYESSALLPPPDPAVNPPFNPSLPAWAASVNLFALSGINNDPVLPTRFRNPFADRLRNSKQTKIPHVCPLTGLPRISPKYKSTMTSVFPAV